jgi:drug/metabolite transporter (DMT)-like permease
MSIKAFQKGSWHHQNLIVNGQVRKMNVVRFGIQCCLFFGIQSFVFLTMYYAHMADVNVGIITTIWSIQPLAAAILDYFIYGEKLMKHHLFGMVFVIGSALCISFASQTKTVEIDLNQD